MSSSTPYPTSLDGAGKAVPAAKARADLASPEGPNFLRDRFSATGLDYYANLSEEQIQRTVIEHLDRRGVKDGNGNKVLYWHPKNGGIHQASARQRMINGQMGVLSGIPDIQLFMGGQLYCLELKTLKGKLTPEQQSIGHRFREQGAITGVCFGLIEALAWLERHNLLIGRAI